MLQDAVITDAARKRMLDLGLSEEHVRTVLTFPEEIVQLRPACVIAQSAVFVGSPPVETKLRLIVSTEQKIPRVMEVERAQGASESAPE